MERMTKMQIWLSYDEFEALRDRALNEFRHPRDEARRIIRRCLLGESPTTVPNEKTAVRVGQTSGGLVPVNP